MKNGNSAQPRYAMKPMNDVLNLVKQRRLKLFTRLGDDVGAVISDVSANKTYLSGYHSMSEDLSPGYRTAVVATRERTALVVSAADAGPALEILEDPAQIFRYGTFYFESGGDSPALGFDQPGRSNFVKALKEAVLAVVPRGQLIGIDHYGGSQLTEIIAGAHGAACLDVSQAIAETRRIKLDGEIASIRKATLLVEAGMKAILAKGCAEMTEFELAALVTQEMVAGGSVPRFVSVTSGPRSALADAYPTLRKVREGELVRLDAGCFVDGFTSDMARTFIVGEPSMLAKRRYDAIAAGLEEELGKIKAGARVGDVYDAAVQTVRRSGIPSYRRHHCGHGLGIGGYEAPIIAENSDVLLQSGMCLCVETPYYEIGWGGMMVEDTIVVTENGYSQISTMPRGLLPI